MPYNGWSETINDTPRSLHTYQKTDDGKWELSELKDPFGEPIGYHNEIETFTVDASAISTAAAISARMGNCYEHALLALHFALSEIDSNGKPIFSELTIMAVPHTKWGTHFLLEAKTYDGNTVYIDPWQHLEHNGDMEPTCYLEHDFSKHNEGHESTDCKIVLKIVAEEKQVEQADREIKDEDRYYVSRPARSVYFQLKKAQMQLITYRERYMAQCQTEIENHLRADYIHPEHFVYFSKYLTEEQKRATQDKGSLFASQGMQQEQITHEQKVAVLEELKNKKPKGPA